MQFDKAKTPAECSDMAEVRAEIDALDEAVIALLGRRYEYVKAAARFKTSEAAVAAPERFKQVLARRREWADQHGLEPDVIERLYRDLVDYFIAQEKRHWAAQQ